MTKTILTTSILSVLFIACNPDKIANNDIDQLIDVRKNNNENLLREMNQFIDKHGHKIYRMESDITKGFTKIHQEVLQFLDSLDAIEKQNRSSQANEFINKTFKMYKLEYPHDLLITDYTPVSLIKLQILDIENIYLREWRTSVTHKFTNTKAVIIPDQITFDKNSSISGTVGFVAFSETLKPRMRLNNKDIEVENGVGHFNINKDEIQRLKVIDLEIIFPDTLYQTSIKIKN